MKISVIGTGYAGLTTGASLANLGHQVLCADIDPEKIQSLEQNKIPFYEPGLKEIVFNNKEKKRLNFTTNIADSIDFGEVIFNCVGTPAKEDGSADLSYVFSVVETLAKKAKGYKVLVNKSTVPPGTAKKCQELLSKINPTTKVEVVSNPEFLKQGNAVYDFNHPDKIVLGAKSEKALEEVKKVYSGLLKTYIPLIETNWETAEMIKYANNSFLATKISFINEIANICNLVGSDVKTVAKAIGLDYRIGPKFLNAGIGYGGSCFPKDIRALVNTAKEKNYDAHLFKEVNAFNERQKEIFLPLIFQKLKQLKGNTVTVWGLSFKPKTSDLRGAASLNLITPLVKEKIKIKVYDPAAIEEARKIFGEKITYCSSLEESVQESNIIILVTEWDEFRNVNFAELGKLMRSKILFDGRNIYEPEQVKDEGFEYYGVGRR